MLVSVGGISVVLKFFFILIVKIVVQNEWNNAVLAEVTKDKNEELKQIKKNFKKRISYKGMYDLHEKVNTMSEEMELMKKQNAKQSQ